MKHRDVLLGLLVVALVGLGVYWARTRSVTPDPLQNADAPAARAAGDAVRAPSAASPPDVTRSDGAVDLGRVHIRLALDPKPPVAFATFRARVQARTGGEGGAPTPLENGRVWFEMAMPMGDHRYSLVTGPDGWQEAEVVLPRCPSGRRTWFATVEGTMAGRPLTARFRFDLAPPGRDPSK